MKPDHDLGYAKVDLHRHRRQGFPEAIYCPGKSPAQVARIAAELLRGGGPVLATRITPAVAAALRRRFRGARFYPVARVAVMNPVRGASGRIVVVTAGTGDAPVAEEAAVTAEALGNRVVRMYDVGVAGLHRLMNRREALEGARVAVVAAGMEGALPSVVGGLVGCPVIGVPTSIGYGAFLGGLAPLLTMLNSCAANVAVVNVDDGFGAGVLASLINQGVAR